MVKSGFWGDLGCSKTGGKPRLRTKKAKLTAIANNSSIFTTQK
jgi:hypothetical protein